MWGHPIYSGGNEITIQKYKIKIPDIDYCEEESGTVHSHNIGSAYLMFNKLYDVEVTAINSCNIESDSANTSVKIEANSKLVCMSERVDFLCRKGCQINL